VAATIAGHRSGTAAIDLLDAEAGLVHRPLTCEDDD
jgi:hypothetical protein